MVLAAGAERYVRPGRQKCDLRGRRDAAGRRVATGTISAEWAGTQALYSGLKFGIRWEETSQHPLLKHSALQRRLSDVYNRVFGGRPAEPGGQRQLSHTPGSGHTFGCIAFIISLVFVIDAEPHSPVTCTGG